MNNIFELVLINPSHMSFLFVCYFNNIFCFIINCDNFSNHSNYILIKHLQIYRFIWKAIAKSPIQWANK